MSIVAREQALLLTCSFAALLGAPMFAAAQEVSGVVVTGQAAAELVQPAPTGSRLGISVLETPASVEVLSGDLIRQRGDLSIVDAVTRATGMSTAANGGNGGTGLSVRGFTDQGSVMQLYDGVRLYPGAGTVTFPFDPWTVDRIEVLRGPASVLFGQGAIGGVVNVIPRKPNTQSTEVEAEAGYGSENTWHVAGGAGGPIDKHLAYRLDASVRGSDGWVNNGSSKSHAISGSIRWAPTDKLAFTLSDDYAIQDPMDYYGVPTVGGVFNTALRKQNYEVADDVVHYIDNQTRLKAEWQVADNVSISNIAYRLITNRTWHNLDTYFVNSAGNIDRTDYFGGEHHQTQYGDQLNAVIKSQLGGGVANTLSVGLDANNIHFQHVNNFTFIDTSGCCDPVNTVKPIGFNPGLFVNPAYILPAYLTHTNQLAFFGEDQIKFLDKISAVFGVRHERASVTRFSYTYTAALVRIGTTEAFNKVLNNTSWRAGLVYQPTPSSSLYVQYTTGTDPLGSLITTNASQINFDYATGRQVEAGYKQTFMGGKGEFTLAAYDIVKKNLLTRDLTHPNAVQQVGQQSSKGIEASLVVPLADKLSIEANGAVLQAKFDNFFETSGTGLVSRAGKRPTNVPDVTANLWLTYNPIPKLRLQGGVRYVGDTYGDAANSNDNRVPDYAVVDAGAAYAVTDKVSLRVNLYNLFDKLYATNTYNPGQWILGRPRAVDVTLSAKF